MANTHSHGAHDG